MCIISVLDALEECIGALSAVYHIPCTYFTCVHGCVCIYLFVKDIFVSLCGCWYMYSPCFTFCLQLLMRERDRELDDDSIV